MHIEEEGQQAPLPGDVDLAAYRIVQEALTNSARHSGGANTTVRVVYVTAHWWSRWTTTVPSGRLAGLPFRPTAHAARAMTKLGARDRAQLVVFAYQAGLVRPGWAD